MLGYDIAAGGGKLIVNTEEARQVRAIFAFYLEHQSLTATLAEIEVQHWTAKRWITRDGKEHLGRPFTKMSLMRLLKNVLYLGRVSNKGEVHAGEHESIVDPAIWGRVNEKLGKEHSKFRNLSSSVKAEKTTIRQLRSGGGAERRERVPRIARLLALALKFEELIGLGTVSNYASLAQVANVSRSRVTQMAGLLNLAPDIQEEILFLGRHDAEHFRISEPSLRKMTATLLWNQQREQWKALRRPRRNSTEVN